MLKFLKNGCLFTILLFIGLAVLGSIVDTDSNKSDKTNTTSNESAQKSDPVKPPEEVIDSGLKAIEKTVVEYEKTGVDTKSENSMFYAVTFFDAIGKDCIRISELTFSESQMKKKNDLLRRTRSLQSKWFPKIRDAYGPIMRKKLWENDVHVKTVGSKYTTVQLAHHSFALNANKKDMVDSMWSEFLLYRFKKVELRWYKEQSEFTYWEIPSASDQEIVDVNKRAAGACN